MQVQGSAHEHDPAVTAVISTIPPKSSMLSVEGNGRLVRGSASVPISNFVHHDPLGGQFEIFMSAAQFAADRQTVQRLVRTSRTTSMSLPIACERLFPGTFFIRPGMDHEASWPSKLAAL